MDFLKTKILLLGIIALILASMGILYMKNPKYDRYVIYFKNITSKKINTEIRYLLRDSSIPAEQRFVSEFLLGPENHDYYSFSSNTKADSVFMKKNILYIDLPETILNETVKDFEFEEFYMLFLKSIFINFKNIEEVNIFIGGRKVYENLNLNNRKNFT